MLLDEGTFIRFQIIWIEVRQSEICISSQVTSCAVYIDVD